jgi:hypothetical protein
MAKLTLTLHYHHQPQRDAQMWLLPDRAPVEWVRQLVRFGVPLQQVTVHLIPEMSGGPPSVSATSMAALVEIEGHHLESSPPGWTPYGRVMEQLILPIHARLEPGVESAEIQELLMAATGVDTEAATHQFVWVPHRGLIRVAPECCCRGIDLLQLTEVTKKDWNRATPGEALPSKLIAVTVFEPADTPSELNLGGDGTRRDDLAKFLGLGKKRTGNAKTRVAAALDQLMRAPSAMWQRLAGIGSGQRRQARMNQQGGSDPLAKLLALLQSDPDRGLRYAPPLTREAGGLIGAAAGLFQFAERVVDFVGKTAGGWGVTIASPHFYTLERKYIELANRELQLKRFRRAAYIFGDLLEDWDSAARALRQGGHWQDAARVYHEKMHLHLPAIECLVKGQFWNEAIDLCIDALDFPNVWLQATQYLAQAHETLGHVEKARDAYKAIVAEFCARQDYLSAAQALKEKLQSPEKGLAALAQGWPNSLQAAACLKQTFRELATTGQVEAAVKRIDQLREESLTLPQRIQAMEVLTQVVAETTAEDISLAGRDQIRCLASRSLRLADRIEGSQILTMLTQIEPKDRLLRRDCQRLQQQMIWRSAGVAASGPRAPGGTLRVSGTIPIARDVRWTAAVVTHDCCYFGGFRDRTALVARWHFGEPADSVRTFEWPVSVGAASGSMLLVPSVRRPHVVFARVTAGGPADQPAILAFPSQSRSTTAQQRLCQVLQGEGVCGVARSPDGLHWTLRRRHSTMELSSHTEAGDLVAVFPIACPELALLSLEAAWRPVPLLVSPRFIRIALGALLVSIRRGLGGQMLAAPMAVEGLYQPRGFESTWSILVGSDQIHLWRHHGPGTRMSELFVSDEQTICGFTGNRLLAVMDSRQWELYEATDGGPTLKGRGRHRIEEPWCVLGSDNRKQFAVCDREGVVRILSAQ